MAWQPPQRLVLAWQLGADWQFDPALAHMQKIPVVKGLQSKVLELEITLSNPVTSSVFGLSFQYLELHISRRY